MMMNQKLQVGDKIRVDRLGYSHYGIYGGNNWFDGREVVHNSKGGGVIRSTLAEFADGAPIIIESRVARNYWEQQAIADRAISLLGKKYDLVNFNCEHAANWAQSGKAESLQVQFAVGIALLGLLGVALATSKS